MTSSKAALVCHRIQQWFDLLSIGEIARNAQISQQLFVLWVDLPTAFEHRLVNPEHRSVSGREGFPIQAAPKVEEIFGDPIVFSQQL